MMMSFWVYFCVVGSWFWLWMGIKWSFTERRRATSTSCVVATVCFCIWSLRSRSSSLAAVYSRLTQTSVGWSQVHPPVLFHAELTDLLIYAWMQIYAVVVHNNVVCILCAAGLWVWIYLLTDLRQPDLSKSHFRQLLKTFYLVIGTKMQCEVYFNCDLEILLLTSTILNFLCCININETWRFSSLLH